VLGDFDTIQKEQKEASSCTDKQDWWLRRSELDRRMKVGSTTPRPAAGHISEGVGGDLYPRQ